MSRKKGHAKRVVTMSDRLTNELTGILSYLEELEEYIEDHPNDSWAIGQRRHYKRRRDSVATLLARAEADSAS